MENELALRLFVGRVWEPADCGGMLSSKRFSSSRFCSRFAPDSDVSSSAGGRMPFVTVLVPIRSLPQSHSITLARPVSSGLATGPSSSITLHHPQSHLFRLPF